MAVVEKNELLIEVDGKVRVERGPPLKTAVATAALLADDVTAPHYHAPRLVRTPNGDVVISALDAKGQPIKVGEAMTYADWLGAHVWKLYVERAEPQIDASGNPVLGADGTVLLRPRWVQVDEQADRETAIALAHKLAKEG